MQDLAISQGSLKSRARALRLIAHVAKDVDNMESAPKNSDLIDFCTLHTTQNCNIPFCLQLFLSR